MKAAKSHALFLNAVAISVNTVFHFLYDITLHILGTDQKGIFRLSGSSAEIDAYVDALDEGGDLHFADYCDVHAVAGLFKLFFRKMSEPLLQFDLYEEFIYVSTIEDLKTVVTKLRPAHYQLTRYGQGFFGLC